MPCSQHPEWLHDAADCPRCAGSSRRDESFIVAEVSQNWEGGFSVNNEALLSQKFERVLNVNAARGYRLLQFQVHRMLIGDNYLNETIIAVFEREGGR